MYNKNARAGKSRKNAEIAKKRLFDAGYDTRFEQTTSINEALSMIQEAKQDGYSELLAIGGDGTMHHLANAAIENNMKLGLIPSGSGNDFANALNIPKNAEKAVDSFIEGAYKKINALEVSTSQEKYYSVNITDVGWGAKVVKTSEKHLKWLPGLIKYNLLALWEFLWYKPRNLTLVMDGKEETFHARIVAAGLGQTFGSGMRILPDARFCHEKMQIAVLYNANRFQTLKALTKVPKAKHVGLPYIKIMESKEVTIKSDRPTLVESEGELHGTTPITLRVVKDILEVVVPKDYSLEKPTLYAR